jgi:hypothetical protein
MLGPPVPRLETAERRLCYRWRVDNRANVALARAIVVAQTVLDHIPPELEAYHSAVL